MLLQPANLVVTQVKNWRIYLTFHSRLNLSEVRKIQMQRDSHIIDLRKFQLDHRLAQLGWSSCPSMQSQTLDIH